MIDFRPRAGAMPRILRVIQDGGFAFDSIRVIPAYGGERSTLCLDLCDGRSEDDLEALAFQLVTLEDAIEIVHRAASRFDRSVVDSVRSERKA